MSEGVVCLDERKRPQNNLWFTNIFILSQIDEKCDNNLYNYYILCLLFMVCVHLSFLFYLSSVSVNSNSHVEPLPPDSYFTPVEFPKEDGGISLRFQKSQIEELLMCIHLSF